MAVLSIGNVPTWIEIHPLILFGDARTGLRTVFQPARFPARIDLLCVDLARREFADARKTAR